MQITVQVAGRTDVGCVRDHNEDAFGFDVENGVIVVCDGIGGHAAGEVASQIAVETVLDYFEQAGNNDTYPPFTRSFEGVSQPANALGNAIDCANRRILEAAAADQSRAGMGSTIVAAIIRGPSVAIAHVGDSRIYLLRNESIRLLTRDHSLVMEQVAHGLISEEEAERSPVQNYILRALGVAAEVQPDIAELTSSPDDVLLFCSDGLTRHLSAPQILDLVRSAASIDLACEALIKAARQAGGYDNITCVLAQFGEQNSSQTVLAGGNGEHDHS